MLSKDDKNDWPLRYNAFVVDGRDLIGRVAGAVRVEADALLVPIGWLPALAHLAHSLATQMAEHLGTAAIRGCTFSLDRGLEVDVQTSFDSALQVEALRGHTTRICSACCLGDHTPAGPKCGFIASGSGAAIPDCPRWQQTSKEPNVSPGRFQHLQSAYWPEVTAFDCSFDGVREAWFEPLSKLFLEMQAYCAATPGLRVRVKSVHRDFDGKLGMVLDYATDDEFDPYTHPKYQPAVKAIRVAFLKTQGVCGMVDMLGPYVANKNPPGGG